MRNHHTTRSITFGSLALLAATSCSLDGQNILLESVTDSSGGQSSSVCGLEVWPAPIAIPDGTANAESTKLTVRNVAVDHPLLTPNTDGSGDLTVFNADFEIQNPGAPGRTYAHDWKVDVTSLDGCAPATTISHTQPIDFPASAINYLEDFEGLPEGTIVTNQFDGFKRGVRQSQALEARRVHLG